MNNNRLYLIHLPIISFWGKWGENWESFWQIIWQHPYQYRNKYVCILYLPFHPYNIFWTKRTFLRRVTFTSRYCMFVIASALVCVCNCVCLYLYLYMCLYKCKFMSYMKHKTQSQSAITSNVHWRCLLLLVHWNSWSYSNFVILTTCTYISVSVNAAACVQKTQ